MADVSLYILESALEAFDTMRVAQATIAQEGAVIKDRFGIAKVHPAVLIERDAKATMLRHYRALGIDLEAIKDVGHPTGSTKR